MHNHGACLKCLLYVGGRSILRLSFDCVLHRQRFYAYMIRAKLQTFLLLPEQPQWHVGTDTPEQFQEIGNTMKYPFCQFCFCIPLFLQNLSKCGVIMSHHVESTHSGASPEHFSTNPADPCQSVANTSMTPSPGLARTTLRPPGRGKEHQGASSRNKVKVQIDTVERRRNFAKPLDLDKFG